MIGTVIAIGVSAYGGFAIADYNAKKSTTWAAVWWKGDVVSLCFAGFGAITHSMPSCIEYDSGPNGGCIQYDSEGPVGTAEAKAQRIFSTLSLEERSEWRCLQSGASEKGSLSRITTAEWT